MIRVSKTLWVSENPLWVRLEEDTTTGRLTRIRLRYFDKEEQVVFCNSEEDALNRIGKIRIGEDFDAGAEEALEKNMWDLPLA